MRTVLRQFFQQKLQLRHIVDAGRSGKGTVHQIMGNVGFQKSFRHIDHACIRITDKMRRASGGGAFRLTGRRKPDVFGSVLFRWIILILQRHIQTDLKAADKTLPCPCWDHNAGGIGGACNRPLTVFLIKSRHAIQLMPVLQKPVCQ